MSLDIENGPSAIETTGVEDVVVVRSHRKRVVKMFASLIQYSETSKQKASDNEALQNISSLPDFFALIGFHELYLRSMYKALLIEFVGTSAFVYFHIAIVNVSVQQYTYPPLPIAIAHAILLPLFIYQFAMSSGAHFNSLVTIASITTGHIPLVRGVLYVGAQIFGAVSGASIMYQSIDPQTSELTRLGGCNTGILEGKQALAIEFFFSLALLFPIYGMAFNLRQREVFGPIFPPILIGLMLGLIIFASASLAPPPYIGAGVNPSMCFGIAWAYSHTHLAGSSDVFNYQWVYWVGPVLASLVNCALYSSAPPFHETISVPEVVRTHDSDVDADQKKAT